MRTKAEVDALKDIKKAAKDAKKEASGRITKVQVWGAFAPTIYDERLDGTRALVGDGESFAGEELARANRYRHALISIELVRRESYYAVRRFEPTVQAGEKAVEDLKQSLRDANAISDKAAQEQIKKDLFSELSDAYTRLIEARKAIQDPEVLAADKIAGDLKIKQNKEASKESGLHWGVKKLIEKSQENNHKGPPPKHKTWDGSGSLAAYSQPQRNKSDCDACNAKARSSKDCAACRGRNKDCDVCGQLKRSYDCLKCFGEVSFIPPENQLTKSKLFHGRGQEVRIDPVPQSTWIQGEGRKRLRGREGRKFCRTHLQLRVGVERHWAEFPIVMDRDLPEDAFVTWVKAIRTSERRHDKWEIHVTYSTQAPHAVQGLPTMGIDSGWSIQVVEPGQLAGRRVGYYATESDPDGGEFSASAEVFSALQKATGKKFYLCGADGKLLRDEDGKLLIDDNRSHEGIVGHIKRGFNDAQAYAKTNEATVPDIIRSWRRHPRDIKGNDATGPTEWARALTSKSSKGLVAIVKHWRDAHGSGEVFDYLMTWLKRHRHLDQYERGLTKKALLRRREDYRIIAKQIRQEHAIVAVEDLDFSQLARSGIQGGLRVQTAPSEFIAALKQAGIIVVEVPAAGTSSTCWLCDGQMRKTTKEAGDYHTPTCTKCGWTGDRDQNAARNILRAGVALVKKEGLRAASTKKKKPKKSKKSRPKAAGENAANDILRAGVGLIKNEGPLASSTKLTR